MQHSTAQQIELGSAVHLALELIKRLGYGRASFDLLRLRVLHGSGKAYQEQIRMQQKKGIIKSA